MSASKPTSPSALPNENGIFPVLPLQQMQPVPPKALRPFLTTIRAVLIRLIVEPTLPAAGGAWAFRDFASAFFCSAPAATYADACAWFRGSFTQIE